jgi:hypothetical protein
MQRFQEDTVGSVTTLSSPPITSNDKMRLPVPVPVTSSPQHAGAACQEETASRQSPLDISVRESALMQELAHERQQRARAESALGLFCQGVHLLTLQLKEADLQQNDYYYGGVDGVDGIGKYHPADDDCTVQTLTETVSLSSLGDDSSFRSTSNRGRTWSNNSSAPYEHGRLAELTFTDKLSNSSSYSNPGQCVDSHLMALQNAAHMVLEHARLASQEAAIVVQDYESQLLAQSVAEQYQLSAATEKKQVELLIKETKTLHTQVEKMTGERRLLVKEVRSLRKELAATKQRGMMQQLERYVVGALTVHEQHLKSKSDQAKREKVAAAELAAAELAAAEAEVVAAEVEVAAAEAAAGEQVVESSEKDPKQNAQPKSSYGFLGGNVALGFGFASTMFQPPTPLKRTVDSIKKEAVKASIKKEAEKDSIKKEAKKDKTPYEPVKFDLCSSIPEISPSTSYDLAEGDRGCKVRQFFSMQTAPGRGSPLIDLKETKQSSTTTIPTLNTNHFDKSDKSVNVSRRSVEAASHDSLRPAAMPCNVSFDVGEDSVKSQLASPFLTPLASSNLMHLMELPEDPRILRSLAMPLVERDTSLAM